MHKFRLTEGHFTGVHSNSVYWGLTSQTKELVSWTSATHFTVYVFKNMQLFRGKDLQYVRQEQAGRGTKQI